MEMIFTSSLAQIFYENGESNYGSVDAAGFDLRAIMPDAIYLEKGAQHKIMTGIKLHMGSADEPCVPGIKLAALILPRSGLGTKSGLTLANHVGLIDQDYQGELCCTMRLRHDAPEDHYLIQPGERIAQLVIIPILRPSFKIVTEFSVSTERGEAGHGSTGKS